MKLTVYSSLQNKGGIHGPFSTFNTVFSNDQ